MQLEWTIKTFELWKQESFWNSQSTIFDRKFTEFKDFLDVLCEFYCVQISCWSDDCVRFRKHSFFWEESSSKEFMPIILCHSEVSVDHKKSNDWPIPWILLKTSDFFLIPEKNGISSQRKWINDVFHWMNWLDSLFCFDELYCDFFHTYFLKGAYCYVISHLAARLM